MRHAAGPSDRLGELLNNPNFYEIQARTIRTDRLVRSLKRRFGSKKCTVYDPELKLAPGERCINVCLYAAVEPRDKKTLEPVLGNLAGVLDHNKVDPSNITGVAKGLCDDAFIWLVRYKL